MIFLLNVALSISSPALSPVLFTSRCHCHVSFHLTFRHPLFLVIYPHFPQCVFYPHRMPVPVQSSVIFLDACNTLVVPRMCFFLILSLPITCPVVLKLMLSCRELGGRSRAKGHHPPKGRQVLRGILHNSLSGE